MSPKPPADEVDVDELSAECAVAQRYGTEDLHGKCKRTEDVPLPHSRGVLLMKRCPCNCHPRSQRSKARR